MRREAIGLVVLNLQPDLILEIAHAAARNGDGGTVATLKRLCVTWREALAQGEVNVWWVAALARFPRLVKIIELSATTVASYRSMYAAQAQAEATSMWAVPATLASQTPPTRPRMKDFIITVEVECNGIMAGMWTGTVTAPDNGHILPWPHETDPNSNAIRLWQDDSIWFGFNGMGAGMGEAWEAAAGEAEPKISVFVTHLWRTARLCPPLAPSRFDDSLDVNDPGLHGLQFGENEAPPEHPLFGMAGLPIPTLLAAADAPARLCLDLYGNGKVSLELLGPENQIDEMEPIVDYLNLFVQRFGYEA